MNILLDLWGELVSIVVGAFYAVPWLIGYIILILLFGIIWRSVKKMMTPKHDYTSLKTVTFGDESTVVSNKAASIISIVLIFLIWGSFTGSKLVPSFMHLPGPYTGDSSFNYTLELEDGQTNQAEVFVRVYDERDLADGEKPEANEAVANSGFAPNESFLIKTYKSKVFSAQNNADSDQEARVISVNGQAVEPGDRVAVDFGSVNVSEKGSLVVVPARGVQMQPLYLPSPEKVWSTFRDIWSNGYQNDSFGEHLGYSLFRVIVGFGFGALIGIPLGYAMGLSDWFRGWFDPIVEFMRPVPPLALIPLVIIWFGIGEIGKIVLLFLAALWIMAIAARSGVSGVNISKVHAAYSLGASKSQLMRHVIMPNSLPDIFTGARVAMGVCWGTVVAAELVAAEKGIGMMIMAASKFQRTDIVIMGIIVIGIVGFSIEMLMRWAEKKLVPWKGKG